MSGNTLRPVTHPGKNVFYSSHNDADMALKAKCPSFFSPNSEYIQPWTDTQLIGQYKAIRQGAGVTVKYISIIVDFAGTGLK